MIITQSFTIVPFSKTGKISCGRLFGVRKCLLFHQNSAFDPLNRALEVFWILWFLLNSGLNSMNDVFTIK